MKMPPTIDTAFFAPCGMNCMVCYKHCYMKKPCAGCLPGDEGKPEHCRKCKIKDCVQRKGFTYCYECDTFPCKLIKNLEKSYNQRYGASLMETSLFVKEHGLTSFMKQQLERYTCPYCGGMISLHDAECSECQTKIKAIRAKSALLNLSFSRAFLLLWLLFREVLADWNSIKQYHGGRKQVTNPVSIRVCGKDYSIPTRSCSACSKQFCLWDLTRIIYSSFIIQVVSAI